MPLVFGDVASIRYPDGDAVLAGQGFALAWHLQGLGIPTLLVTRVDGAGAGRDAVHAMEQWGLDTRGVQRALESSMVPARVERGGGTPRIKVADNQPWDRICADEALRAVSTSGCTLIAHGTRALRSASNLHVLDVLIDAHVAPVYFHASEDIGALDPSALERCLARSKWVSVCSRELADIAAMLDLHPADPVQVAERLRARYEIDALFVTANVDGAYAVTDRNRYQAVAPARVLDSVDRVGVEEAFSAVVVYGLNSGWPVATCLRRAQGFVELMAALPMPEIPAGSFYDDVLGLWAAEDPAAQSSVRPTTRATAPIPKQERLPAEIEQATQTLDALKRRRASARMKAAATSQRPTCGDSDTDEALTRARRSVELLEARIGETERRLRNLNRAAHSEPALDDANAVSC